MPYVFVEELEEGQEEAQVVDASEYSALQLEYETAVGARDMLQQSYDALAQERDSIAEERDTISGERDAIVSERDSLAAQLDDAKTKFANAFLSSPQRAKEVQREDSADDGRSYTFDELFAERNKYNAN